MFNLVVYSKRLFVFISLFSIIPIVLSNKQTNYLNEVNNILTKTNDNLENNYLKVSIDNISNSIEFFSVKDSVNHKVILEEVIEIWHSPISRHEVDTFSHFLIFLIHDISAIVTLMFYAYLLWLEKGDKNHHKSHHVLTGRLCGLSLVTALITGFLLIFATKKDDDVLYHIIPNDLNKTTVITQGYVVIGIILDAFVHERYLKNKFFSVLLILFHIFSLVMGFKSLAYLLGNIFPFYFGLVAHDLHFQEISFELLFLLTIPQILCDSLYIYIHYLNYRTNYSNIVWKEHHSMSIVFLIYLTMVGILFSFIHDKYWIFNEHIDEIYIRIIFCAGIQVGFLIWNRGYIKITTVKHESDEKSKFSSEKELEVKAVEEETIEDTKKIEEKETKKETKKETMKGKPMNANKLHLDELVHEEINENCNDCVKMPHSAISSESSRSISDN